MLTHHVRGVRLVLSYFSLASPAHSLSTGEGWGGGLFLFVCFRAKTHSFPYIYPNVTQYVLCYIRTLTPYITAYFRKTLGIVKKLLHKFASLFLKYFNLTFLIFVNIISYFSDNRDKLRYYSFSNTGRGKGNFGRILLNLAT